MPDILFQWYGHGLISIVLANRGRAPVSSCAKHLAHYPTITGGCVNPSKGRFLHPSQDRSITLREAALLQSFPKGYRFSLSRGKFAAAAMIGNALPPAFVKRHALAVKKSLIPHA
jgi:site-specific DNA-cytosine methylase